MTRVLLTRAAGGNDELAGRLLAAGLDPVECPLISIEVIPGPPVDVRGYDWLVLTSRWGVRALVERGWDGGLPRIAVIGPGTARAAVQEGIEPALVPRVSTQEGLVAAFADPPGRVLFAGAEDARDVIALVFDADIVSLYRTIALRPEHVPAVDLAVVASASAAGAYAGTDAGAPVVSIGPITTAAARAAGLEVVAEAETHDLDGLEAAVRVAASRIASSPS